MALKQSNLEQVINACCWLANHLMAGRGKIMWSAIKLATPFQRNVCDDDDDDGAGVTS
jgi:hypothetical protein